MQLRPSRALLAVALTSALFIGLAGIGASAQGVTGGGGGGTTTSGDCVKITVTNTGQTVRDFKQPDIKYNLENCGTNAVPVTVTVSEAPSAWYPVCASPVAAPADFSLALKAKVSATFPTYRGPCGYADNKSFVVINSVYAFQRHNLLLTATNSLTGQVLAVSTWFSWQDCLNCGGV